MNWSPLPEMMWKSEPQIEAARKLPAWAPFHRLCGRSTLFFDHIEKRGRGYSATAFTTRRSGEYFVSEKLADGTGATVIAALEAAYRAAGRVVPGADELLDAMAGRDVSVDDFSEFLG